MDLPTRSEIEATLAERMAADPAFRAALLADPRGVVSEAVGVAIPDNVQVILHEESLTQIHLTIPASGVLTDDELEMIGGGTGYGVGVVDPQK